MGDTTEFVRHAIAHWLQNEQNRQLLELTAEEVAAAWAQMHSDSWDTHFASMKNVCVAGDAITLLAASHVYVRSICMVQPDVKTYAALARCNKHVKRFVLIARAGGNYDVAPLHWEIDICK